jgi:putative spermidine/putrescine transport system ATP-binding protein
MTFLTLERVTKRFGDQVAVNGINLEVQRGEFVSLLGPSGCGKTTTLQMIAGFTELSEGAIRLDGRDLADIKPARRGLGIVFQSYALFPHMTAAENVAFGLEMRGIAPADRVRRVSEALALVGLAGYEARYPRRMSGGQQQRVALARAIVIKPNVLLLDEPLSNLDAKLREEMQIELRQIQRNLGTTTILVTHDQHEAMALSDRIVVMNKGVIEQVGTPLETYERPASPFVAKFLGKTNEFPGQVQEGRFTAGGLSLPVSAPVNGAATLSVRPERLAFAETGHTIPESGLAGTVKARIFQGNHWLYQLETEAGPAILIRQNDGTPVPEEGAAVRLTCRSEDVAIRPGAAS